MKAALPIRVRSFSLLSRSQYVEQFQQMGCIVIPRRTEVSFLCFFLLLSLNSPSALMGSIISTSLRANLSAHHIYVHGRVYIAARIHIQSPNINSGQVDEE